MNAPTSRSVMEKLPDLNVPIDKSNRYDHPRRDRGLSFWPRHDSYALPCCRICYSISFNLKPRFPMMRPSVRVSHAFMRSLVGFLLLLSLASYAHAGKSAMDRP